MLTLEQKEIRTITHVELKDITYRNYMAYGETFVASRDCPEKRGLKVQLSRDGEWYFISDEEIALYHNSVSRIR